MHCKNILILILPFFLSITCFGQFESYNLQTMLADGNIVSVPAYQTVSLKDSQQNAISTKGIVWLKGINFTNGIVDIDFRGKDAFLKSFLGLAFHATDTSHCDILYFRPFNFRHIDSTRWKWSVAYMQLPDFNYARLRKESPGVYEDRIKPAPLADQWFHSTLLINGDSLFVYVNHQPQPSLKLKMLNGRRNGLFGLYSDGLTNDFANLQIMPIIPGISSDKTELQVKGIHWLANESFEEDAIDVDVRGRNVSGQSFVGMAFNGTDSNHCEVVYFRPFNFESSDSLHRQHMVQYMSLPNHSWNTLRTDHPGEFEKKISLPPHPDDWFHARIVVLHDSVEVYVNHSKIPDLKVKRFRNDGHLLGFWSDGLPGDFTNLVISPISNLRDK